MFYSVNAVICHERGSDMLLIISSVMLCFVDGVAFGRFPFITCNGHGTPSCRLTDDFCVCAPSVAVCIM